MRITGNFCQVKNTSQNSSVKNSNLNYISAYSSGLNKDTVSFKKAPTKEIEAAFENILASVENSAGVGARFHSEFLEPALAELASKGVGIRAKKMGDDYIARLIVTDSRLYTQGKNEFKVATTALDLNHSIKNYKPSEYPFLSQYMYQRTIHETEGHPVRGLTANHAIANLIQGMRNSAGIAPHRQAVTNYQYPNQKLAQQLPSNENIFSLVKFKVEKLFPVPKIQTQRALADRTVNIEKHLELAADRLFPRSITQVSTEIEQTPTPSLGVVTEAAQALG